MKFGKDSAGPPPDPENAVHGDSPTAVSEPVPDRTDEPRRRRAEVRVVRVEPYSVTRLAFVVSVALMIVGTVAVAISWILLALTGVWGQINQTVASLVSDNSTSFNILDYVGFGRVVGATLILGSINVILLTGLATIAAHLYNLAAALLGGIEATFSDDD